MTVGEIWPHQRGGRPYIGDNVDIAFEFDFAILDHPEREQRR